MPHSLGRPLTAYLLDAIKFTMTELMPILNEKGEMNQSVLLKTLCSLYHMANSSNKKHHVIL